MPFNYFVLKSLAVVLLVKMQVLCYIIWKPLHKGNENDGFQTMTLKLQWWDLFVWEMCGQTPTIFSITISSACSIWDGSSRFHSSTPNLPLLYWKPYITSVSVELGEFKWNRMQDWILHFIRSFFLILNFFIFTFFVFAFQSCLDIVCQMCLVFFNKPVLYTV